MIEEDVVGIGAGRVVVRVGALAVDQDEVGRRGMDDCEASSWASLSTRLAAQLWRRRRR